MFKYSVCVETESLKSVLNMSILTSDKLARNTDHEANRKAAATQSVYWMVSNVTSLLNI